MKPRKVLLSLVMVAAMLLASALPVDAIGFTAEDAYESVFVVYSGRSLGSGFAIGKNCIVTNAHVISGNHVTIQTYDGDQYNAQVIGINEEQDIAVLGIAGMKFPYLKVTDHIAMNTGDDVYAIGAPKSMAYTLTKGVISAKERTVGGYTYIQIDAAINEGNSGGPLLNDAGQVIGMNTLKMSDSEGIGLAIPMSSVCDYLQALGIVLDENGNATGDIDVPLASETDPANDADDTPTTTDKQEKPSVPFITVVSFAIAAISLTGNVVLAILLIHQQKKNLPVPYDPRERTDFDIDILE